MKTKQSAVILAALLLAPGAAMHAADTITMPRPHGLPA